MGEVYRARDTKLNRDVAIKVLREPFVQDRDRLARFEREARLLAALNHPHIGSIYGLEEVDGVRALVLELVEGPTLQDLGRLSVNEALSIARQIVDALDAAHEKGIIHRDLKPSNVKVAANGTVKVLDFGLGKALGDPAGDWSSTPVSTATEMGTRAGVVLGTPAYMSPEQTRGEALDKRTDIWAFGCLLYELLTGRPPFRGATVPDTISAILSVEPDWLELSPATPAGIRRLLRNCLKKSTTRRLRDIGDARPEIEDALGAGSNADVVAVRRSFVEKPVARIIAFATAVVATVTVGFLMGRTAPQPAVRVKRLMLPLPVSHTLNEVAIPFALSNDGSTLAYASGSYQGSQLFLRPLDGVDVLALPGTLAAMGPFFSPDDKWIGFKSGSALKKLPAGGGAVVKLCDLEGIWLNTGASWAPEGIFFSNGKGGSKGIARVSGDGGSPRSVTTPDARRGEIGHQWPQMLPGTNAILFTIVTSGQPMISQAAVQSLATGERNIVLENASRAQYVSSGHLIFGRGNDIFAVAFNLGKREVVGSPVRVIQGVSLDEFQATPLFAVAEDGTLAFAPSVPMNGRSLVWVDRKGVAAALGAPPRGYDFPAISPDGQRIAVRISDGARGDLWLYRPFADTLNRLTSEGDVMNGVWTPDSAALTFSSFNRDGGVMFRQGVANGVASSSLFAAAGPVSGLWPGSWSSDGKTLFYMQGTLGPTSGDIFSFHVGTNGAPERPKPYLQTEATEWGARISPDGRWMAYVANDSGRWEVYIQAYPGPGGRIQVSTEGGTEVVWARNGRELYYRNQQQLMAVPVRTIPVLEVGKPARLFESPFVAGQPGLPNYDVSADGSHFLMIRAGTEEAKPGPLNIVLNWFNELRKRIPVRR
jgi:serine/threonine-protein kinase